MPEVFANPIRENSGTYNQNRDQKFEDMTGEAFLRGTIKACWKVVQNIN